MAEIDVSTDALLALSTQVGTIADDLDRRRIGVRDAVGALAPQLGGEITGHALSLADAADLTLVELVDAYRAVAATLSTSAGVYVDVDTSVPGRQSNPALR